MKQESRPGFETICVHYAEDRESQLGAAAPPLYQCSTFTYPDAESFSDRREGSQRFDYTRVSNPTTQILERKIALLERGESCRAFGSGMAAISAAILSCIKAGDHIITINTVYGPTRTFLQNYMPKFNVETTFVRGTQIEQFEEALRPNTKLIYVESPSSLLFELQDLAAVSQLAKSRGIHTICDNSNATPFFQNPLEFGIDMVVHTATKYIGGHSDLVAGLVISSNQHMQRLARDEGELLGGVCDPFTAWLMLRGLRTLSLRLERHQRSATLLARLLETDPRIERVFYSGLEAHPQVAIAKHQMRGHSGLVSFVPRNASRERVFKIVNSLQYFCIAVSWGGHESLAIPHEFTDPQTGERKWLIRLSVGLESLEDLKADIYKALEE